MVTLLASKSGARAEFVPPLLRDRAGANVPGLQGTYFYPGLGNCGKQDNSNSWIVAISRSIYAKGKYCERVRFSRCSM
jgi:hypothetical protein